MAPAKRSRNRVSRPAIIVTLLGVLGTGALAYYVLSAPIQKQAQDRRVQQQQRVEKPGVQPDKKTVTVVEPRYGSEGLTFKATKTDTPKGQDPIVFAVNRFLRTVKAVPADAKLLSATVRGETVTLNFNGAIQAGYGTEDEQILVNGLLQTLEGVGGLKTARFQVEGQPLDSLGNLDLSGPIPVAGYAP